MRQYQEKYIEILRSYWEERKERNASFSLRSFARFLGLPASALSLVMNGKRPLTSIKANEIVQKLDIDIVIKEQFLEAVKEDEYYRLNETERKERSLSDRLEYQRIKMDHFQLINDWYHFGILNICKLSHFQSDTTWIAASLGIDEKVAAEAIERLLRLELLEEVDGRYIRSSKAIETSTDIPSEAIRSFHKQNFERAANCMDTVSVDQRDMTSIMMPVNKARLQEAKKMIKNFRRELSAFLESGGECDDVYSLNIQLFPQTQEVMDFVEDKKCQ